MSVKFHLGKINWVLHNLCPICFQKTGSNLPEIILRKVFRYENTYLVSAYDAFISMFTQFNEFFDEEFRDGTRDGTKRVNKD